jgi:carboxyl-terminal processing protease
MNKSLFSSKKWLSVVIIILLSGIFLSQLSQYHDIKLRDNQIYFRKVFLNIAERYVDDVNLPELLNVAIDAMVDHLDPFSEYIEKEAKSTLQLITEGTYGGLGMEIGMREGNVTVISPIEDTPAKRAGIRAGDIIRKINGKPVKGMELDEVSKKLRGPVGTEVTIEIERPGFDESLVLTLRRAKIVLKDVTYADFIAPGIAYVKLTGFTDKAPNEMIEAIKKLQQKGEIKGFILDLRNNPGGLLMSAIRIANIFLPKGTVIVTTKGKAERERVYKAIENPLLPDVPVAVLVNRGSASASEIVTGAIQDLDRGVVVGDTTFGKGLVQKVIPIDDLGEKQLKLTTAKYYTPSGRCIQKEDYKLKFKNVYQINNRDSLLNHKWYTTAHGRKVWSNGGIVPDVKIKRESLHPFLYQLLGKGVFFKYVVQYLSQNPERRKSALSVNDEELFNLFLNYLGKNKIYYESPEQKELKKLLSKLEKRSDFGEKEKAEFIDILTKVEEKDKDVAVALKNDLIWALKLELANQLDNKKLRYQLLYEKDDQLKKAVEILENQKQYEVVLGANN